MPPAAADIPPPPRRRRFKRDSELELLREMRRALLPKDLPARPALDMASCFLPADDNVGGDFFVVGEGRDDSSIVVVGDVVGRGLEAALRASYIRALLAGFVRSVDDPARILMLTNAAVVADEPSGVDFVTAACVVHRPRRREVTWALAGHPAPLRLDDGTPLPTALIGPPIGIDEQFDIAAAAAPLRAGDGVLVYTDGIVEARSATGELFGDRRLSRALAALRGLAPADTVDGLRREIEAFTGGPFDDDVCMIALRARPTMADGEAEEVCSPNLVAPLPDDAAA